MISPPAQYLLEQLGQDEVLTDDQLMWVLDQRFGKGHNVADVHKYMGELIALGLVEPIE